MRVWAQSHKHVSRYRDYPPRWAYVIEEEGHWPFVSRYHFHSERAAIEAGETDARATGELKREDRRREVDES